MSYQQKHSSGPSRAKGSSGRRSQTRTVSTLDAPMSVKRVADGNPAVAGQDDVAAPNPNTGPHLVFNFNYYLS